jgi:hypothetical protein
MHRAVQGNVGAGNFMTVPIILIDWESLETEASTRLVTLNGNPSSSKPLPMVEFKLVHIACWARFDVAESGK